VVRNRSRSRRTDHRQQANARTGHHACPSPASARAAHKPMIGAHPTRAVQSVPGTQNRRSGTRTGLAVRSRRVIKPSSDPQYRGFRPACSRETGPGDGTGQVRGAYSIVWNGQVRSSHARTASCRTGSSAAVGAHPGSDRRVPGASRACAAPSQLRTGTPSPTEYAHRQTATYGRASRAPVTSRSPYDTPGDDRARAERTELVIGRADHGADVVTAYAPSRRSARRPCWGIPSRSLMVKCARSQAFRIP
jgi:hypothetical protein